MNKLDEIHNELVTYAYNRTLETYQVYLKMRQSIENNQPSSIEPNKSLNLSVYIDQLKQLVGQLDHLEKLSVLLCRIRDNHEPITNLIGE